MSALELVLRQPWMARLGWTLVHFLWQGTAIAAAYAAARAVGGRFLSARSRYALACAALAAMAAAPPITFLAARVAAAAQAGWQITPGPAWEHALPWLVLVWVGILGWTAINIGEEDLEGVTLSAAAAPISGVIHVEGAETSAEPPKMPTRVTLTSVGALAIITVTGAVDADGAFTIPMAAPGLYSVELTGLPAGSYLKTLALSRTGSPDQIVDWRGADSGTLELGVSRKAATLAGKLVDGDGKPVEGTVTLAPVPARPGIRRLYPTAKADLQGAFQFPSLTPGTYKVYSWENIESSAHWDVDFIRPFESRGEPTQVEEGGGATVSLRRISSAEMTDTLTKAGL